jgi:fructokinase
MKRKPLVIGLGEILWDIYPDKRRLGGAPTNAAIHLYRHGAQVVVVSAVGDDHLGQDLLRELQNQGLSIQGIQRCSTHPTGTVQVHLDKQGDPSFICSEDVAFDHLRWTSELEKIAEKADVVLVGTLAQRQSDSYETIQRFLHQAKQAVCIYDANFREWNQQVRLIVEKTLKRTDILKINEHELILLRENTDCTHLEDFPFLRWLINLYDIKRVALSKGKDGCQVTDGFHDVTVPSIPVSVKDTTGCGDAFIAGFIWKLLQDAGLKETATYANCLGAFMAMQRGAVPTYALDDVLRFCQGH